ncbi:MAG: hypothetical protein J7K40_11300, partial [candidate division Zixibacteria bacterium]|nr:hypothetical protein [candidate division Zixibacteria bacterium]
VTISDYVTIWDLLTGEVAEDVFNEEGEQVVFPCHKDELMKWLEKIPNKPTRQVLKDEPEDNRDYLVDNGIDIGNENRVEWMKSYDPSINCYFGVSDTAVEWGKHEYSQYNMCGDMSPRVNCAVGHMNEWTYPKKSFRNGCSVEACEKCFHRKGEEYYYINGYSIFLYREFNIKYFDPYSILSKRLFLCSYPAPACPLSQGVENPFVIQKYTNSDCASYEKPILMKSSAVDYSCTEILSSDMGYLKLWDMRGRVVSFFTSLGSLIIDYSPAEMGETEIPSYDLAQENKCGDIYRLADGASARNHEWVNPNWCRERDGDFDKTSSECNRFGVSWCGSPTPREVTKGWYRVLLRFYMGQFHGTSRRGFVPQDCETPWWDPTGLWSCPDCVEGECVDTIGERFSSVHATIELEKPEEYPKLKDTENPKYERPEDYDDNPDGTEFCLTDKKYSELCAFPGRERGSVERENEDGSVTCYPFDGTYILHTLGAAVEELINGHYKDGSDDQLLVYLYERPNMIKKEVRK